MSVHNMDDEGLLAPAAGMRTRDIDSAGKFLNIPRRAPGDLGLSARKDHNILPSNTSTHHQQAASIMNQS